MLGRSGFVGSGVVGSSVGTGGVSLGDVPVPGGGVLVVGGALVVGGLLVVGGFGSAGNGHPRPHSRVVVASSSSASFSRARTVNDTSGPRWCFMCVLVSGMGGHQLAECGDVRSHT